jgi:hypothetical protein
MAQASESVYLADDKFTLVAPGTISGDGNGNLSGTFTQISTGLTKLLTGSISSSVPAFLVVVATLHYDTEDQFTGTYDIGLNATIGQTSVSIPLVNASGQKMEITGNIKPPYLTTAYAVTGSIRWSST